MKSSMTIETVFPSWPLLMKLRSGVIGKSDNDELIVLFHCSKCGTVVHTTNYNFVGYYSNDWIMSEFERFNGTVKIKAVNGE